jgi:hydroxyethylthiazole kinase-like uncharacterized protein yjeF
MSARRRDDDDHDSTGLSPRRSDGAHDGSDREAIPEPDEVFLLLGRREIREIDRLSRDHYGIPTLLLMENAARAVAEEAITALMLDAESDDDADAGVLIICGPGNNGGDGLAAARHLHNSGIRVGIVLAEPMSASAGDAQVNLHIARRMGVEIIEAVANDPTTAAETMSRRLEGPSVIIDALLGVGLNRAPQGPIARLIDWINSRRGPDVTVISVDLPSGLDADTGVPAGDPPRCVRADTTVTFCGFKSGFVELVAQEYLGEVVVADVGAPRELIERLGIPVCHPGRVENHHAGDDARDVGSSEPPDTRRGR